MANSYLLTIFPLVELLCFPCWFAGLQHTNVSFIGCRNFQCLPPSVIFLLTITVLYFVEKETLILVLSTPPPSRPLSFLTYDLGFGVCSRMPFLTLTHKGQVHGGHRCTPGACTRPPRGTEGDGQSWDPGSTTLLCGLGESPSFLFYT